MPLRDPLANPEPLIRRVYAYAAYRLGDGADAEDVTSDTFERALRYRASYDPAKGTATAWLVGIARRCADDLVARRLVLADPTMLDGTTEGPEDEAITRITVRRAVLLLDRRDRELIALRYGADLSARQIGALLDLRTNTVEVRLHRALGRLRERLEGKEAGRPERVRRSKDEALSARIRIEALDSGTP
jgi:RNA polymerase sigma-70 factor, ECF subfamily